MRTSRALCFLFAAACSESSATAPRAPEPQGSGSATVLTSLGPAVLDAGTLEEGQTVEHTFFFLNDSEEPLADLTVRSNCNCTTATLDRDQLEPGAVLALFMLVTTESKHGHLQAEAEIVEARDPRRVLARSVVAARVQRTRTIQFQPSHLDVSPSGRSERVAFDLVQAWPENEEASRLSAVRVVEGAGTVSIGATTPEPSVRLHQSGSRTSVVLVMPVPAQPGARQRVVVEATAEGPQGRALRCRCEAVRGPDCELRTSPAVFAGGCALGHPVARRLWVWPTPGEEPRVSAMPSSNAVIEVRAPEPGNPAGPGYLAGPRGDRAHGFDVVVTATGSGPIEAAVRVESGGCSRVVPVLGWGDGG